MKDSKEKDCYFLIFQIRKLEQQIERLQCEMIDKKLELEIKRLELCEK